MPGGMDGLVSKRCEILVRRLEALEHWHLDAIGVRGVEGARAAVADLDAEGRRRARRTESPCMAVMVCRILSILALSMAMVTCRLEPCIHRRGCIVLLQLLIRKNHVVRR